MNFKLKAVTLIELLVVMLVSTIVIGVCYFSYLIAYNQLGEYKKVNQSINQAVTLNALLKKDFILSKQIQKSGYAILFTFDKKKERLYQFNENNIIRIENMIKDTFKIEAVNLSYFFCSEKQEKNGEIIDELKFEAKVLDKMEQFHYVKEYDAETLITHKLAANSY